MCVSTIKNQNIWFIVVQDIGIFNKATPFYIKMLILLKYSTNHSQNCTNKSHIGQVYQFWPPLLIYWPPLKIWKFLNFPNFQGWPIYEQRWPKLIHLPYMRFIGAILRVIG